MSERQIKPNKLKGNVENQEKAHPTLKTSDDRNLKEEKGAILQEESGAELTAKKRLNAKPAGVAIRDTLPTYGKYIKNRRRFNKYAAKVKEYAQPYNSDYEYVCDKAIDSEPQASELLVPTEDSSLDYSSGKPIAITPIITTQNNTNPHTANNADVLQLEDVQTPTKIKSNESKQLGDNTSKLALQTPSKLQTPHSIEPHLYSRTKADGNHIPQNSKEQKFNAHHFSKELFNNAASANTASKTSPIDSNEFTAYQYQLHKRIDKLLDKSSKLHHQRETLITRMPSTSTNTKRRIYNENTGTAETQISPQKRILHQEETSWNNPTLSQKLKHADSINNKAKVIAEDIAVKGVKVGAVSVIGASVGVGATPALAGLTLAKPTLKYGSKLMQNSIHRQIRKDIQQSDNELLQVTHWAEQKAERAIVRGVSNIHPKGIYRYIKNTPYRRESKLQKAELKNDRQLGLLRVKQAKATGINHVTGNKSNALSRALQKRAIKKNYQKAFQATQKRKSDTLSTIAREVARGNPSAIATIVARKTAIMAVKFSTNITIFNPVFWKLLGIALVFLIILGSIQACVALFSPGLAGVGSVNEDDISFVTRRYSEWEVDMRLFLSESNIIAYFPPPTHITNQTPVEGVVIYPPYPYTPPPPFHEVRFEIGMIRHDPMELISYITARHGERFDLDTNNPMTHFELEELLKEIFEAQYGIRPGDFEGILHEDVEIRSRRERHTITITYDDDYGTAHEIEQVQYVDTTYYFWILTVRLESKSLSDVLRSRMTIEEAMHFDVLNLTGNGRQVVGNPFNFNWLPHITSHYGYRINPTGTGKQLHLGIDIATPLGTEIFATHTGIITQVQFSNTGYGNMIHLRGQGLDEVIYETLFAHLHEIFVINGQTVTQGDLIATVGSTGDSTGSHLHLEVFRPSQPININGSVNALPAMHLNPLFAVITWTDDQGNDHFRPAPGEGGTGQHRPPFFPEIPPDAMSDARFAAILSEAVRHLGARYVWGAAGPNTFDCSGFIHWVFTHAGIGWTHGRTNSQGYFNISTPISPDNARPGDLVFFHSTHSGSFITHVGIYVGNGQMIHTGGNPAGVEFVSIHSPFWQKHFYSFGRV